jgi:hypothetical protein
MGEKVSKNLKWEAEPLAGSPAPQDSGVILFNVSVKQMAIFKESPNKQRRAECFRSQPNFFTPFN